MTIAVEWLITNRPGRMESHPAHQGPIHPLCILQEQTPEELHNAMCDAAHHDDWKQRSGNNDEMIKMNVAFIRAHGMPKGEVTTFLNVGPLAAANGKHVR